MSKLQKIIQELNALGDPVRAKGSARFFKTGEGQYGEGDVFIGIAVPAQRQVAKKYLDLCLSDIQKLLKSKIHEFRFTALEILVFQFEKANEKQKAVIFRFYLANTRLINNWDLVDTSCRYIIGEYLIERPKTVLYKLSKSKNIWERRIAIVSTAAFIAKDDFSVTLKVSETLLADKQDLIHKAVGWMLREMGKRDQGVLKYFLQKQYKKMPRTMLRYAIEKFSIEERKKYLKDFIKQKLYAKKSWDLRLGSCRADACFGVPKAWLRGNPWH